MYNNTLSFICQYISRIFSKTYISRIFFKNFLYIESPIIQKCQKYYSLGRFVAIPATYPSRKFTVSLPHTGQKPVKSPQWRLHPGFAQRLLPNSYPHVQQTSQSSASLWQTGHLRLSSRSIILFLSEPTRCNSFFLLRALPTIYTSPRTSQSHLPSRPCEAAYSWQVRSGNVHAPDYVPDIRF